MDAATRVTFCPETVNDDRVGYCAEPAWPEGDPALLGGTALVSLQRWRCRAGHRWDKTTVIAEL